MVNKVGLAEVLRLLRAHDRFLVTTHVNPDGDAIGTMLGVAHFLAALGKADVRYATHDPVPKRYQWLPGADRVHVGKLPSLADAVVVIVDVAQLDRIGVIREAIGPRSTVLVLDHHLEDRPDGAYHYIDAGYSSAAEIVVDLFDEAGLAMTRDAAICAYVGLATDTGGFRFSNTNPASHRRAARLLEAGIDVFDLSGRLFDEISMPKFVLMRRVLDRTVLAEHGRCAHAFLRKSDLEEARATVEDLDGLVNIVRNIEGVQAGLLFREEGNGKIKVSLRSRAPFNAARVLQAFGGGGHAGAAGATVEGPLDRVQASVLRAVKDELNAVAGGSK